jgi:hypothetical protein
MMMSINHKTISVSLLLLQEQIQGPFCKNGFWVFFVLEFQSIGNGNGSIDPSMILPLSSICYEGMKGVPWH